MRYAIFQINNILLIRQQSNNSFAKESLYLFFTSKKMTPWHPFYHKGFSKHPLYTTYSLFLTVMICVNHFLLNLLKNNFCSKNGQFEKSETSAISENWEIRKLGIIFARFLRFSTFSKFRFAIFSFYKKIFFNILKYRNSHLQMLLKIGVLKNFAISTGKNLCWSLFFNKVAERRATTLL